MSTVATTPSETPVIAARAPASAAARARAGAFSRTLSIFKRELAGYFVTPVAYVFIVVFLLVTGVFTFELGQFYERGQADLRPFFDFHPWLYLFLIPAISMRLWAEERKQGTIELLMTLPVPLYAAVLGKYLAAWAFAAIALVLTFPMWITVNYLGNPDNGVIAAAYIGSLLMAGGFLAIGSWVSAMTKNQVIAFVVTVVVCFGFLISGYPPVIGFFKGWAPQTVIDAIASFSFLTHFDAISKGLIDIRDILFFGTLILFCLFATGATVELKKS
jgi:ABC-2 type transport system permease protein